MTLEIVCLSACGQPTYALVDQGFTGGMLPRERAITSGSRPKRMASVADGPRDAAPCTGTAVVADAKRRSSARSMGAESRVRSEFGLPAIAA